MQDEEGSGLDKEISVLAFIVCYNAIASFTVLLSMPLNELHSRNWWYGVGRVITGLFLDG